MARGSVQRRFLQRLRGSALALDYNHGVAETSPLSEIARVRIIITGLTSFAALHMSAFGTKRTFRDVCYLSAFTGKADICQRLPWSTLRFLRRRQLVCQLGP